MKGGFNMKVVLKEDIKGTGKKGEIHEVSAGYARNYLFPRNLAVEANTAAVNEVKMRESAKQHHKDEEVATAQAIADKINGKTITVHAKGGESGRLFGAVTAKDIAEAAEEFVGVVIDKRKIALKREIKNHGSYDVEIKVYAGITATITVVVEE